MKRNMISVIILALLVVNIVLTALMMFSITSTNKKTANMITAIASAMDMEITAPGAEGNAATEVAIKDRDVYVMEEKLTIPLKKGADGKDHYFVAQVSFSMNKKDKDYKTYGADMSSKETLIRSEVGDVIGSYTLEEIQADQDKARQEILDRVQKLFDSKFIFEVAFSDVIYS